MTDHDRYDYVDGLLNDAGEEWRAGLGPPPVVEEAWFASYQPSRMWWRAAAVAAAIAILAGVVAFAPTLAPPIALPPSQPPGGSPVVGDSSALPTSIPEGTPPRSPEPTSSTPPTPPAPNPFDNQIVREGDLVSVTGRIIDWSAGPRICTVMAWDLSNPPQPGCVDSRALPIIGVDPRDLPGADWRSALENFDNVWVTDSVRVFGTWRAGTIEYVDSISAEMPPSPFSSRSEPVPCAPPAGGWPGDPYEVAESETLRRRLQTAVDQQPELYAGLWRATDDDGNGNIVRALVVGTVGEVSSVETHLREIFPANLCVIRVEYNTLALEAEEERLSAEDRGWFVQVEPKFNRVAVWLPAILDQSTADLLAQADGKVRVFPNAERIDADPPPNGDRICGRVDQVQCDIVLALVREARPDLFTSKSVEIVEYDCPPGAWCSFLWSYTVVLLPTGCPGNTEAFSVAHLIRFDGVEEYEDPLPAHIAELLPAECAVDPPP